MLASATMIRQNTYGSDRPDELHPAPHDASRDPARRHGAFDSDWTPTKNAAPAGDHASESADPPSKRRRVALACTVCRGRKSRVSLVVNGLPPGVALTCGCLVRWCSAKMLAMYRAGLRVCLSTIFLIFEYHRGQRVRSSTRATEFAAHLAVAGISHQSRIG
jgi:hypothetical protein